MLYLHKQRTFLLGLNRKAVYNGETIQDQALFFFYDGSNMPSWFSGGISDPAVGAASVRQALLQLYYHRKHHALDNHLRIVGTDRINDVLCSCTNVCV